MSETNCVVGGRIPLESSSPLPEPLDSSFLNKHTSEIFWSVNKSEQQQESNCQ